MRKYVSLAVAGVHIAPPADTVWRPARASLKVLFWSYLAVLLLLLAGCGGTEAYSETFDETGDWRVESNSDVEGEIRDGVYDFIVKADDQLFWTNPGLNFSDGLYEVEATQIDGPLNNAYGMLFRLDDEESNFYAFQISGDGYVWIGRYYNGVPENEALINDWWFASDAINQGLNVTNTLAVRALHVDCDADTLLLQVDPAGPACHTGANSCFYRTLPLPGGAP